MTPKTEEEIRQIEQTERQVELDAIALFGNSHEFPPVANAFVQGSDTQADPYRSATEATA